MIPLDRPLFLNPTELKKMLNDCIDSSWVSFRGNFSNQLSQNLTTHFNLKYAIPVSSGTYALYLAVAALDLPTGSEVIVPTFCYNGNITAIIRNGLIPKFIDTDFNSPNTSIKLIKEAITTSTKAIMIPHMYGKILDLTDLKSLNIKIIEDTALTFDPSPNKVGDIICTSFQNKIITSGEGGAVLCSDDFIYEKLIKLFFPSPSNEKDNFFLSGRLSNLSSALALSQLSNISKLISSRNKTKERYDKNLNIITSYDVCWRYQIKDKNPSKLITYLKNHDIEARSVFKPVHSSFSRKKFYNAETFYNSYVDLPSGPAISSKEISYVCSILKKYWRDND